MDSIMERQLDKAASAMLQKSLEEAKRDYYNYKIWNVNDSSRVDYYIIKCT
jgi:NAD(P)H-nitrite reductase large subunit